MTLCRQKVTKQVKMCGFLTTTVENSAFAIFTHYVNFSSSKLYHKATAPISTSLFTLCPMPWRNVMGLIQNWDDQNQQAKSFQMRYNLSKLIDQNYQTLRADDLVIIKQSSTQGTYSFWARWCLYHDWKLQLVGNGLIIRQTEGSIYLRCEVLLCILCQEEEPAYAKSEIR